MITSSHNPAEWNGVKYKASYGGAGSPGIISSIETYLLKPLPAAASKAKNAAADAAGDDAQQQQQQDQQFKSKRPSKLSAEQQLRMFQSVVKQGGVRAAGNEGQGHPCAS